ncbi:SDR family NAD(P)-dependent oxidoreductase [Neobacillus niacini]|uniref:SDR family NAD(P)-dependent oxidoreductase n=1 Tax=Neobacillus niacini TaxID=86668 RepID=UPI0021CB3B3D|nr:SDR family NAD(P)-dependent oxidoreductase [Neobacillus niacini]MCM3763744.1 SDR family NAD(P)-dependent oxidoreductase [Neobacillus niacini]
MKVFNKVIVVTGAGGGIGRELIRQLLERGAKVAAIIHKSGLEEMESFATVYSDRISTNRANIANRDDVEKLPDEVIAAHGCIDGMIGAFVYDCKLRCCRFDWGTGRIGFYYS